MRASQLLTAVLLFCLLLPSAAAELKVGLATGNFTPRRNIPLGGYGDRFGKLSKGVHDPVKVRVLYITDGKQRLAWATLDLVGISAEFHRDVTAALPARLGLKRRNLLLAATHTHCGPGGMTKNRYFQIAMGFFDKRLYRSIVKHTVRAIAAAFDDAKPARIGFGSIKTQGLTRNRRTRGGQTDPELSVIKVTDSKGKLRAVLANLAAHPTILGGKNMKVSAGWPGAFCAALEQRYPGVTAIFTNGAEGDQSPRAPSASTRFGRVAKYGQKVAGIVADNLAAIETSSDLPLLIDFKVPALPPTFAKPLGRDRAPLQRIRLGKMMLLTIPGELVVSVGLRLKQQLRKLGFKPMIVGLANDHLGYIVDRRLYIGGGYESMMNFFGPEMDRWFIRHHLLDLLPAQQQAAFKAERDPQRLMQGAARGTKGGLTRVTLSGHPYQLGFQHGRLLAKEIKAVLAALAKQLPKKLRPLLVKSKQVPTPIKFLLLPKVRELALPALCIVSRKMHAWLAPGQMDEMLGLSHGAGVSYEEIFLLNVLPTLIDHPDPEALIKGAMGCTNAVLLAPSVIHGRNFDWGLMRGALVGRTVVFSTRPRQGQRLLSVGYPGMIGVFSAVNSAGLSFGWESVPAAKDSRTDGASVLLLLRQVAQQATTLEQAVSLLRRARGTLGYHYTITDGKTGRVLECSATQVLERKPVGSLLLGSDPARAAHAKLPSATPSGKARYNRLKQTATGAASTERMFALLSDRQGGVLNGETLHQAVMAPARRELWVRAGAFDGKPVRFRLDDKPAVTPKAKAKPKPKPQAKPRPRKGPLSYKDIAELKPDLKLFDPGNAPFKVSKKRLGSFPYRSYRIEFPSSFKSPHACNNTVYGFYYVPRRKAKGAVILLPIWKGPDIILEKTVAVYLTMMGFKVFIMPHAYQFERSPKGVRSGSYTISTDLVRTRNAFIQTVQDARRAATWLLRDEGVKNLAVMGISLGGIMSSLVYSIDKRFKAASLILGGGDLGGLMFRSKETRRIKREAARQKATVAQVRHALRAIEPLTWAEKSRGAGVFMINGTKDTSVLPENAKALASAYGIRPYWIPTGHYDGFTYILRMLRKSASHMQKQFAEASKTKKH